MRTVNLETLNIHKLSQEQYDREYEAGRLDETALYLVPEDSSADSEITEAITALQTVVTNQQESINSLGTSVSNLQTSVSEQQTSMTSIQTSVDSKSTVNVDDKFMSTLNIYDVTKAEYEAMETAGTLDTEALYLVENEEVDLSNYVDLTSEQTISGFKHFGNAKLIINDAVNLEAQYASDGVPSLDFMGFNGDEFTRLSNVATPANSNDAATKAYVDGVVIGKSGTATGAEIFNNYGANVASGQYSHAEGWSTQATGYYSHAEGWSTKATGYYSHAEGSSTEAAGYYSHAAGYGTIANKFQTVVGKYNINDTDDTAGPTDLGDTTGSVFVVGIGTSTTVDGTTTVTRKNGFRISAEGKPYALGVMSSSGADYAEYFEWADGNPDAEDRCGRFVTLDGEKIRYATADDEYILGAVSAEPTVVGDIQSESWKSMCLKDIFGRTIYETVEVEETTDGNGVVTPAHTERRWVLNPEYDPEATYVSREYRPEWDAIGIVGKLVVTDDGTCQVNGYCYPGTDGIATNSNETTAYRVINRLDDNHVKIFIK